MAIDTDLPDTLDGQGGLFEIEDTPLPVSLADRFVFPPFSVLDRRQGAWQDRKRAWMSMGFQSEIGRGEGLLLSSKNNDPVSQMLDVISPGTSVFDPVVAELAYRWFSRPGDRVLDPFAGGSVRGLVASALARYYDGVELREEQVIANRAQEHLGSDIVPQWIHGDARLMPTFLDGDYDMAMTCPPYADLEVYSDDPADLSAMDYDGHINALATVLRDTYALLRPDRFLVWVTSDVRKTTGGGDYRALVADTIKLAQFAGFGLYNDAIIIDPVGTTAIRSGKQFDATRKLGRSHQHMLIFVKGDGKVAGKRVL